MSPPAANSIKSNSSQGTKTSAPKKSAISGTAKDVSGNTTPAPSATPTQSIPTHTGPLQHTPIAEIAPGVEKLVTAFHTKQKSHTIQYRLNQLRNIYFAVKDNADALADALYKDFYRSPSETKNLEITVGLTELVHTMASLHKWAKPEPVKDLPISMQTNNVFIEKIPLGVVLVISPFNYPFLLTLSSVVGALAAGNAVVLKMSEATPNFTQLFGEILTEALDEDIFFNVNGAIPETTEVLEQKYDKIMYTGNGVVGKIIAKKAAETLTPVILELGGKSPAFVLDDISDKDLTTIARRIVWGRFTNAGQTCVAVDYVAVHEKVHAKLVKELVRVTNDEFYPSLHKSDADYTHIIHDRAFQNLSKILAETKGNIVASGTSDAHTRFFPPAIVDNVSFEDSTMSQELFGPILPIVPYSDLKATLSTIQQRHDTPLAQYIFTSKAISRGKNPQIDTILRTIRSGATIINDVILHVGLVNAPFGGIGQSGYGAYHGEWSFRNFTHERTTIEQKLWNDFAMKARYPPFSERKVKLLETASTDYNGKVWFGRSGNVAVNGPSTLFSVWTGVAGISALVYYFAGGI